MVTAERLVLRRDAGIPERNISDFRIEYGEKVPDKALIDDVVSYLGEYRFNLPKFSYNLKFSGGKLRDPHRNDSMEDISQKAVDLKEKKGQSSVRERAEKEAFRSLNEKLQFAKEGQSIIWISPPGPKQDGYGDYGFIFFGKVGEEINGEKNIKMEAIRLEQPTIERFNKALSLLSFKKTSYASAEDFLAHPEVLEENISEQYVDSVLENVFSFRPNDEEQRKFQTIIQRMFPLISHFIGSVRDPWKTRSEKIKELYSLENYALELKREQEEVPFGRGSVVIDFRPVPRMADIVEEYGHNPPKASGSCPTKDDDETSLVSSNIFSKGSFLNNLFGEQEWFHCPECGFQADGPIGNTCPGCKLTKDEYAKKSGISCD